MSALSQDGMTAKSAVSNTILNEKVNRLKTQNDIFGEIENDWLIAIDRIKNIGLRLNYNGHPDNVPQNVTIGEKCNPVEPFVPVDGLIGEIDTVIENRKDAINRFNNFTIKELNKNLSYLEQHI